MMTGIDTRPGWRLILGALEDPDEQATWTLETDERGEPLAGTRSYTLHFDLGQEPPARSFWCITMHDDECLPVDNAIRRFSLGDRSMLWLNDDGSFDIFISSALRGDQRASNWLPASAGPFHLVLTIRRPLPEALNGDWHPPLPAAETELDSSPG